MNEERSILFDNRQEALALLGDGDEFLEIFRKNFSCRIHSRGDGVDFAGHGAKEAAKAFYELMNLYRRGVKLTTHEVRYAVKLVKEGRADELGELFGETVLVTAKGRHIRPKTLGQRDYIAALKKNPVVFGLGPAGTGKTYLAVVMAAIALRKKLVERVILTRPAVEAGEHLGFLPGDIAEKVDPYLRPLYDALQDILGADNYQKFKEKGIIEIAPLAFMRGRTLSSAFVILDEAQNCTEKQLKMFLTRIGENSHMAVTGDPSQVDLPPKVSSGLLQTAELLQGIKGVAVVHLSGGDIVRSALAGRIAMAFERHEQEQGKKEAADGHYHRD